MARGHSLSISQASGIAVYIRPGAGPGFFFEEVHH